MISNLLSRYEKGKSNKIKLIALCIKAVTGVLGTSLILNQNHPYLALAILALGALANEVLNFITDNEQPKNPDQP